MSFQHLLVSTSELFKHRVSPSKPICGRTTTLTLARKLISIDIWKNKQINTNHTRRWAGAIFVGRPMETRFPLCNECRPACDHDIHAYNSTCWKCNRYVCTLCILVNAPECKVCAHRHIQGCKCGAVLCGCPIKKPTPDTKC